MFPRESGQRCLAQEALASLRRQIRCSLSLRRRCLLLVALAVVACLCRRAPAQSNEWTWTGGSNVNRQVAVYGTLGQPSPSSIPGGRYVAATWTDKAGHFWMFGGQSFTGKYDDLWEFDPASGEWAWMGGQNQPNTPGVYGIQGKPAASNWPGARAQAASWTDSSGHFWLFGGYGADSTGNDVLLNDVWEFGPSSMQWTWVAGSSTVGGVGAEPGIYGVQGTAAAGNTPGSRLSPTVWADKSGKAWLFGGLYADTTGVNGGFNDFWEFDPATSQWTWMGGDSTLCNYGVPSGVWGTMGTFDASNIPSCRWGASGWTDRTGICGCSVVKEGTLKDIGATKTAYGSSILRPSNGRGWAAHL